MEITKTMQVKQSIDTQYFTPGYLEEPRLHSLQSDYRFESEMQGLKYHFSKSTILQTIKNLKTEASQFQEDEKYFQYLCENLEQVTWKYKINIDKQIKYTDDKEKYKVYICNEKLCYLRNDKYIPINTVTEYKEHFKFSPSEDEERDKEIPANRKGKSQFSCFSIDKNRNLYISPYKSDVMQHTYATTGEEVLFAGTIRLNDGKICYVDNKSGHYRVGAEFMYVFFETLKNISQKDHIKSLFAEKFDIQRQQFSENMSEIIKQFEYGVNLTSHPDIEDFKDDAQLAQYRQKCSMLYI